MTTTVYYKYRLRCVTEATDVYTILESTSNAPTNCPNNTAHTIDSSSVAIVDEISDSYVTIKEEVVKTGGSFGTKTITFNVPPNSSQSISNIWSYPITALLINYISEEIHKGDEFTISVGEGTTIGAILSSVSPASTWSSQNYTVGQKVTYTHPKFGDSVFTCILNTVSNENPSNTTYWKHGYELFVSSTVIIYTSTGYWISLYDGVNTNILGHVISVDKLNNKIYMSQNPSNSFSYTTPTYVLQTVYLTKDFMIGSPGKYDIGSSKIGGMYLPAGVNIKITYKNNSVSGDNKIFTGRSEYLY